MDDFYALSVEAQTVRMESLAREVLTLWPGSYTDLKMVKYRENAVFQSMMPKRPALPCLCIGMAIMRRDED